MPYIGNTPAEKYAAFNVQYFTTSATTSYTLDRAVANELDIRLVINNVIQEPGAGKAYTAANTTLTLTSATAGGDTMYAVYIGKAVQTVNPGAGSVGTTALADNAVTEAKLNVSNSPVNGYVLSAQSGATGGLTWAADAAGTITAFTNGVDNRLVTATSATALNGESTLTYDGTQLVLTDGTEGTDNLLVKTTADGSISMALEKSDLKYDLGLDHNNDGSQNFYIRERTKNGGTTNSKRMVIDNSGAITKPLQPAFLVRVPSDSTHQNIPTGVTTVNMSTEIIDKGSNWSTSTFTAPVTGTYFFQYQLCFGDLQQDIRLLELAITTSNRSMRGNLINPDRDYSGNAQDYVTYNFSCLTDMDVNDTAIPKVTRTSGTSGTDIIAGNDANVISYLSGYLVC